MVRDNLSIYQTPEMNITQASCQVICLTTSRIHATIFVRVHHIMHAIVRDNLINTVNQSTMVQIIYERCVIAHNYIQL